MDWFTRRTVRVPRWCLVAVLGLLAATAALIPAGGAGATTFATGEGAGCGYATGEGPAFTENEVMRWAQVSGEGEAAQLIGYGNDEEGLLLGVEGATSSQEAPGNEYPTWVKAKYKKGEIVNETGKLWEANVAETNEEAPAKAKEIEINKVKVKQWVELKTAKPGSHHMVNPKLGNETAHDVEGRPLYPVLYITNITKHPLNTKGQGVGDWQNIGKGNPGNYAAGKFANEESGKPFLNDIFGAWTVGSKLNAKGEFEKIHPSTSNEWNLGTGSDAPVGRTFAEMGVDKYGAEVRWNVGKLRDSEGNLLSGGNKYRVQIIEHDGDQNKTGGDVGQFCETLKFPAKPELATKGVNKITKASKTTIEDRAWLSGASNELGGILKFTAFKAEESPKGSGEFKCTTEEIGKTTVKVNKGAAGVEYSSSEGTPAIPEVPAPGTYGWQVTYEEPAGNATKATEACGATSPKPNFGNPPVVGVELSKVRKPEIKITKSPAEQTRVFGEAAEFTIEVENNGEVDLEPAVVEDEKSPECDKTIAVLKVGAKETYTCTAGLPDPFNNFAEACGTAHGEPGETEKVCNHSEVEVKFKPTLTTNAGGPYTLDPKNGNDLSDKATLTGGGEHAAGEITFKLFADNGSGGCGTQVGSTSKKAVNGASNNTYESASVHVTKKGTYHWTAEYSGSGKTLPATSGCGAANENPEVKEPKIRVLKEPPSQTVKKGEKAKFTITVENDGEVDLENVKVTDEQSHGCGKTLVGKLKVNAKTTYPCESEPVEEAFENTAEACGESQGVKVCEESKVPVGVETPASEQDFKPSDTFTISVEPPEGGSVKPLNGTVAFSLFKGACGTGSEIYKAGPIAITDTNNGGEAATASEELLSKLLANKGLPAGTEGEYNWQIKYEGDTNGNKAFTDCGEHFVVTNK